MSGDADLSLRAQQRRWNSLAERDALWTILGRNDSNGAEWSVEEFFETGRKDIALMRAVLGSRNAFPNGGRALDFGCGIGRLSQALCDSFDEVVGVDIAPAMIEQANRLNRYPDRCRYHTNAVDDLRAFGGGTFSLVVSRIVLQHLPLALAVGYLTEFLRVLAPGGTLVVQVPSKRVKRKMRYFASALAPRLFSALRRLAGRPPRIPMHVIPQSQVKALLEEHGGRVIHVESDGASGTDFESLVYYVIRTP